MACRCLPQRRIVNNAFAIALGKVSGNPEARCGYVCVFEDYIYSRLQSATLNQ
jgi:hypothetical protein